MLRLGVFIAGPGIGNMVRAVFGHFARGLKCDARTAAWAGALARVGYFGRGVAMLPAGVFMLAAGWHARASEAKSLGGVLQHCITSISATRFWCCWPAASWPSAPSISLKPSAARSARKRG